MPNKGPRCGNPLISQLINERASQKGSGCPLKGYSLNNSYYGQCPIDRPKKRYKYKLPRGWSRSHIPYQYFLALYKLFFLTVITEVLLETTGKPHPQSIQEMSNLLNKVSEKLHGDSHDHDNERDNRRQGGQQDQLRQQGQNFNQQQGMGSRGDDSYNDSQQRGGNRSWGVNDNVDDDDNMNFGSTGAGTGRGGNMGGRQQQQQRGNVDYGFKSQGAGDTFGRGDDLGDLGDDDINQGMGNDFNDNSILSSGNQSRTRSAGRKAKGTTEWDTTQQYTRDQEW
ncbi:Gre1p KNAG_0D00940 [Huiozyma naganishii CBS 8797]|uniref:Uncharacterized protein n=1 Tax=Huiozyma naganishii (strain ATCC MYA-139 / BCRC 22969 / CBS 8797 / KCTC 17520 / NBRC 10181 / NCYC 3082 / Yp74L-3) TaxID=1071383 RepID=J7S6L7_HUIN7|nr:hypothetical protein KNAG_0D00940 [Kazachstania naganishii CBS 8797]CCK69846.1 hypothetical protein KNAG_0D00940 [Kazachstania naganishii CBS 8797]